MLAGVHIIMPSRIHWPTHNIGTASGFVRHYLMKNILKFVLQMPINGVRNPGTLYSCPSFRVLFPNSFDRAKM
jgi:hypothetical protein